MSPHRSIRLRLRESHLPPVLNASFGIQVVTDTDVILADFNQFEAGAFATSPMAAAGAARNADLLSYATSGNFGNAVGSAYAELSFPTTPTGNNVMVLGDPGANLYLLGANSTILRLFDGTNTNDWTVSAWAVGSVYKIAQSWGGVLCSAFLGGSQVSPATKTFNGSFGIGTNLGVMNWLSQGQYGFVRNLRIYSRALTDAQLQVMTA